MWHTLYVEELVKGYACVVHFEIRRLLMDQSLLYVRLLDYVRAYVSDQIFVIFVNVCSFAKFAKR